MKEWEKIYYLHQIRKKWSSFKSMLYWNKESLGILFQEPTYTHIEKHYWVQAHFWACSTQELHYWTCSIFTIIVREGKMADRNSSVYLCLRSKDGKEECFWMCLASFCKTGLSCTQGKWYQRCISIGVCS
jgi:hypothetical protein